MGSYRLTLNMKAILVLLLATCLLVEAAKEGGRPRNAKNNNKSKKPKTETVRGRHADKGERVWHVAASEEECGDASAVLYQSHDKPYDLCNEVNSTINVCTTRDTEMVPAVEKVDMTEDVDESENEIEARHNMDEVYQPKEGAEWDFKTGTCVFRLSMEHEEGEEDHDHNHSRKKKNKKNKKVNKAQKKRKDGRAKLRQKVNQKNESKQKNNKNNRRNNHESPSPRSEN